MKPNDATIIVVDDEPGTRATLCGILEDAGYRVIGLDKGVDVLETIRGNPFDAIIADIRLSDIDGIEILELAKKTYSDSVVIMMTGYASIETAVDAVNKGAYAYFVKPVNPDELKTTIGNALKQQRLSLENKRLVESLQHTNKLLLEANEELRNEISERKRIEEALRESEENYRMLFQLSPVGITTLDMKGVITSCNPTVYREGGYSEEELIGKHFSKIAPIRVRDIPKFVKTFASIVSGRVPKPFEVAYTRKDGSNGWTEVQVALLEAKGRKLGIQVLQRDITERKQAEELYRTLAESSPVGVYIVQDGKYCFVNPQFQKYTGYSEDELLNMHPLELVHPEDREKVNQNAVKMLKGNTLPPDEFRVIHKGGETHWAMRTVSSIYYKGKRANLGNFMDITERKKMEQEIKDKNEQLEVRNKELQLINEELRNEIVVRKWMEEALQKSEQELAIIFETSSDAIRLIDLDFNIRRINSAMEALSGLDSEAFIGRKCFDVSKAAELCHTKECPLTRIIKTKERISKEAAVERHDGTKFQCILTVSPVFDENGAVIGILEDFVDITERKQMERELQEKNEQLDAQNEELQSQAEELIAQRQELIEKTKEVERANQLKSAFLANMSHELRTPLNVIIGFSELMADEVPGKINKKQRQCLNDVLTSSQHLLNLINGVLDLSRIEAGKVELKPKNVALTKVIASLTRTMMPILTPMKQSLDAEIEEGLPLVYVDEGKLAQVLLNLVDNASKFSPDRSKLKVRAVSKGDWCQVSVIDKGVGIKKEDQERIFEPFSRLNNPLVKERGGTGLGLALVKQIVERYGGQIWVESKYRKGSCFTFTLPLATSSKPNLAEKSKR